MERTGSQTETPPTLDKDCPKSPSGEHCFCKRKGTPKACCWCGEEEGLTSNPGSRAKTDEDPCDECSDDDYCATCSVSPPDTTSTPKVTEIDFVEEEWGDVLRGLSESDKETPKGSGMVKELTKTILCNADCPMEKTKMDWTCWECDDRKEPQTVTPKGSGMVKDKNQLIGKVTPMVEQWKCEVCGVWDGCAVRQLEGEKIPINCLRYEDRKPKWELRKYQEKEPQTVNDKSTNEVKIRSTRGGFVITVNGIAINVGNLTDNVPAILRDGYDIPEQIGGKKIWERLE